jgi:hypothetical protein
MIGAGRRFGEAEFEAGCGLLDQAQNFEIRQKH